MSAPIPLNSSVSIETGTCGDRGRRSASFGACSAQANYFGRVVHQLKSARSLTIGYLGGSLTDGSGASDPERFSWRALTTRWFREQFPQASVREVNAAIGGTGSEFGLYRMGEDLLAKQPDLVFVEFSVNDSGLAEREVDLVSSAMEGIVRRILMSNPQATIVFVYTTMKSLEPYHVAGELSPAAQLHDVVAGHYGIPSVPIGEAVWQYLQSKGMDWNEIMPDNVHPTDEGYAVYAEAMIEYLAAQDWTCASTHAVDWPQALYGSLPLRARQIRAADYANAGWLAVGKAIEGRKDHLYCETPGQELHFSFAGDVFGLVWISADDAGVIEYSIDGAEFIRASSWTPHGGKEGRLYGPIFRNPLLNTQLDAGAHEVTIRVASEPDPSSEANRVRIVAFIVNETD